MLQACQNVLNDDVCRVRCPEQFIIDPDTRTVIPNPEFKFEAKPLCVSTCPGISTKLLMLHFDYFKLCFLSLVLNVLKIVLLILCLLLTMEL